MIMVPPPLCNGEGNGNPLQDSCLENPRDRGAWWAAIYGVTQSWTWLKWLSSSSSSHFANTLFASSSRLCVLSVCSVTHSCPTLCNPMDCSPLGSNVHWILQARILEWQAISFSRGSSQPRDLTHVSCIDRQVLYYWVTWEAPSSCEMGSTSRWKRGISNTKCGQSPSR